MNRHLIVGAFLATTLLCSAADNGDGMGIFQKRQVYIYRQLVKQLGLVDIGRKHERKFAQNLKFIHAIVPSGLLFYSAYSADEFPDTESKFAIVAIGDWRRTMVTGTIHSDDSLEGCLRALAWRFAGITMSGADKKRILVYRAVQKDLPPVRLQPEVVEPPAPDDLREE